MSRKPFHRTPKEIIITVKENPLDVAAAKYIKLFNVKIKGEKKKASPQKSATAEVSV